VYIDEREKVICPNRVLETIFQELLKLARRVKDIYPILVDGRRNPSSKASLVT